MSRGDWKAVPFSALKGKTLVSVEGMHEGSEEVVFVTDDGARYHMLHYQNCCESVELVDVDREYLEKALPGVVTEAEVAEFDASKVSKGDSATWTFYKFSIGWRHFTLRWVGVSNGYYSESVDFRLESPPTKEAVNV